MGPVYDEDGITIWHGDCTRGPAASWYEVADILITDPPYGTRFSEENPKGGYGRRQNAGLGPEGFTIENDGDTVHRDMALALWRMERPNRPIICFGSPRLPDPPGEWRDRLVWNKTRPGMNGGPWRYQHETIFATDGFERVSDSYGSIMSYFPEQDIHIHGKPLALMERLVSVCPEGVIADPFMGSGTTLVAAKKAGRRAVGVEVDERYVEAAIKRLAQGSLF